MSRLNNLLGIYALMAHVGSNPMQMEERSNPNIDWKPKNTVITKGCREFLLDVNGDETEYRDMVRFTCIASNLKNARKKFNKSLIN